MQPLPTPRSTGTRRRRRALVALAAGLSALPVVAMAGAPHAGALPKRCDDGSPPPCVVNDTTTTSSTLPPPPNWSATVSVLDQTSRPQDALDPNVRGYWSTAGSPHYVTQSGDATWTDPTHTRGSLSLFATPLPTSPVGFQLFELSRDGRLCRATPVAAVPASGQVAHVLLAPEIFTSASDLQAMAAGLEQHFSLDGADITVFDASLVPLADNQLGLHVSGHLSISIPVAPDATADFDYTVNLHIAASRNVADPSEVMTLHADPGTLTFSNTNVSADVLLEIAGDVEPGFRSAVQGVAQSQVNSTIAGRPEVKWFGDLGYTVSVRTVTTTPTGQANAGLSVVSALCKVG